MKDFYIYEAVGFDKDVIKVGSFIDFINHDDQERYRGIVLSVERDRIYCSGGEVGYESLETVNEQSFSVDFDELGHNTDLYIAGYIYEVNENEPKIEVEGERVSGRF